MKLFLVAAMTVLTPVAASAGPAGKWRVGDGSAVVSIKQCGPSLCGSIAATADKAGVDENNPNPALRSRSLVGLPILDLHPEGGNKWSGNVYNAKNGQNYSAHLSMNSESALTLEGCVQGTNICGSESWSRTK